MNIRFYFRKIDQGEEDRLRGYLTDKKMGRLTRLLQHGNFELAELILEAEHFPHHHNFSVKLDLVVGKRALMVEKRSYNLIECFDLALDGLISQLRKLEGVKHGKIIHQIRHGR